MAFEETTAWNRRWTQMNADKTQSRIEKFTTHAEAKEGHSNGFRVRTSGGEPTGHGVADPNLRSSASTCGSEIAK